MIRSILIILIVLHGLLCSLGFLKAFGLAQLPQITKPVAKTSGSLWLAATLLFVASALLIGFRQQLWWIPLSGAITLSQYLIIIGWHDAKFGTIANLILLVAAIVGYGTWHFEKSYRDDVKLALGNSAAEPEATLTEADLHNLPEPVKRYVEYSGAIGKPKVRNFRITFEGKIRGDSVAEWMPFESEQYNTIVQPERLFFMKAIMKNLPVAGYHHFKAGTASMDIRLLSLYTVQYASGPEMDTAETVTYFNDMCCMAPATLIDNRIRWDSIDNHSVRATFISSRITVTATLTFNERSQLVNFVSPNRYALTGPHQLTQLPWSTPLRDYREFNGHHLASYADAIYAYPTGPFCYGTFTLKDIEYNVEKPR